MFYIITVLGNIQWEYKPINRLSSAVAGIVGYAVGKASYVGTCREKFNNNWDQISPKGLVLLDLDLVAVNLDISQYHED